MPALTEATAFRPFKRVGHRGAGSIAPPNSLASFELARQLGVDMIEFDVIPGEAGGLIVAHDAIEASARPPLGLDAALDLFAGPDYAGLELDVDLKLPGYERAVVEALAARGLAERSLVSSQYPESLRRVGETRDRLGLPGLRRGWSVPRVRRDWTRTPLAAPAHAVLALWRRRLPARAAALIASGGCEALMAHVLLVTPRLVDRVRAAGGELYVWTVDDPATVERLSSLGVDAVISNDPRVFRAPALDPGA